MAGLTAVVVPSFRQGGCIVCWRWGSGILALWSWFSDRDSRQAIDA